MGEVSLRGAYYVDPVGGSDSNAGTSAGAAFATITKARDVVRTVNSSMTGDITIYLMPGDYEITSTVALTAVDSGTNGYNVVWRNYGERGSARLIGGTKTTGWTLDSGSMYKVTVGTGLGLQSLFENGVRAVPARYPNSGYLRINAKDNTLPSQKFQWKSTDTIPSFASLTDLKVYVWPGNVDWSAELHGVSGIDTSGRWITMSDAVVQSYLGALEANSRYRLEGAKELLDQAGEFSYNSTTGVLYYIPFSGSSVNSAEVIVPKVSTIFSLSGASARWALENNTTDSVSGASGTAVGSPTYVTGPASLGNAISLNGSSQYVSIANTSTLSFGAPSSAITIAGWIKTSAAGAQPLLGKGRPTTFADNMDYRFGLSNGKIQLYRWNQTAGVGEAVTDSDGTSINDGTWHHIAFVNEGASSHKLYVDGTLVETSTTTWLYNDSNANPAEIGRFINYTSSTDYFNGAIDDVRIYRRALDASEIGSIAAKTDQSGSVNNVTFSGLKFVGTNMVSTSYSASGYGMITIANCQGITVSDCSFANIGGNAIYASGSGHMIYGNYIEDSDGGGIKIQNATYCAVLSNRIKNINQVFADTGGGIGLYGSTHNTISYNEISQGTRHGIVMRSHSDNNTVSYNEVYSLDSNSQDTGAIYWYDSDGNVVDHNRVHDSGAFGQSQHGIYVDDASDSATITNNIVFNIGDSASTVGNNVVVAKGVGTVVQNNVLDFSSSFAGLLSLEFGGFAANSHTYSHNILYTNSSSSTFYYFANYASNRVSASNSNVFYRTGGGTYVMAGIPGTNDLPTWKTLNSNQYDQSSVTQDPLFTSQSSHNYTLQGTSPALGLGFVDIDTSAIGLAPDFVYPRTMAQWIFEGNASDITGNGNTGTNSGATYVTDRQGTPSSALSFDGSSNYVSVPDNATLDFGSPANPFSVVAWVKTSSSGPIITKGRPSALAHIDYIFNVNGSGKLAFSRWHQSPDLNEAMADSDGASINDGKWHCVAFVNEGTSSHKLYVDGVLVETSTSMWTYDDSNAEAVNIGRYVNYTFGTTYFSGTIDDVAVYQRQLTADEIRSMAHIPHS